MEQRMSPIFNIMECYTSYPAGNSNKAHDLLAEFLIHAQYITCLDQKYTQSKCENYYPNFKTTYFYFWRNDATDSITCQTGNNAVYRDLKRTGYNYQVGK